MTDPQIDLDLALAARERATKAFKKAARLFARNPHAFNYSAMEAAALHLQDATYKVSCARSVLRDALHATT